MECIDLRERFGDHWRVEREESYWANHVRESKSADPWLMIIPCKHGHLSPWSVDHLAACTKNSGAVSKRLARLPFVTVQQDGDDGTNCTFHLDRIGEIAKIMQPCRKRRMTHDQREEAITRLAKYRFSPQPRTKTET